MKKIFLLSLLVLFSISAMSQEKGSYISIYGGLGPTGYKYNIQGVNNFATPINQLKLGGQAGIGYSYYFTKHFGLSTGVGISHYRSYGRLMGLFSDYPEGLEEFKLGNYQDNDPFDGHVRDYNLRVRTENWTEYQSGKFIEIPLLINLQKKFGEKEGFGLYLALGAKAQIPIKSEYSIVDDVKGTLSGLNVYGYYQNPEMYLGRYDNPDLSQHGFGQIYNPSEVLTDAKSKLDHKFNVSLVGEAGFLISLSRRVDLALGAFVDYGLLDLKRKTADKAWFTGPGQEYVNGAEGNVANNIIYNSITQTEFVPKVSTFSYGGKLGVRIKLGKLSSKEKEKEVVYVPRPAEEDSTLNNIADKIQSLDSMMKEVLDAIKNQPAYLYEPEETEDSKKRKDPAYMEYYSQEDLNIIFEPIYFDLNKAILKSESIAILNDKVVVLNKYKDLRLLILGNTCDIGKDYYNFELGARRAEAAKKYLVGKGITSDRLETSTHSKYVPEMPNINEDNRTHNRRDDFRPLFPKAMK